MAYYLDSVEVGRVDYLEVAFFEMYFEVEAYFQSVEASAGIAQVVVIQAFVFSDTLLLEVEVEINEIGDLEVLQ